MRSAARGSSVSGVDGSVVVAADHRGGSLRVGAARSSEVARRVRTRVASPLQGVWLRSPLIYHCYPPRMAASAPVNCVLLRGEYSGCCRCTSWRYTWEGGKSAQRLAELYEGGWSWEHAPSQGRSPPHTKPARCIGDASCARPASAHTASPACGQELCHGLLGVCMMDGRRTTEHPCLCSPLH